MTKYQWVQGDHEIVETDLTKLNGAPSNLDLTGRTVHFVLRHYNGVKVADKKATLNETTATVELTSSNLSRESSHKAEWVIVGGDDDPTTYPKDKPISVYVRSSVDDEDEVVKPPLRDGTIDVLTANGITGNLVSGKTVTNLLGNNLTVNSNGELISSRFSGSYNDLTNTPNKFVPKTHGNDAHSANYTAKTKFNNHLNDVSAHHARFTSEEARDAAAAMLSGGSNVTVNVDDANNTVTISATQSKNTTLSNEEVEDIVGGLVVASGASSVLYNDGANELVISSTDTQLSEADVKNIVYPVSESDLNFNPATQTELDNHNHSDKDLGTPSSPVKTVYSDTTNTGELSVTEDFNPAGTESVHFNFLPPVEYLRDNSSGSGFGAVSKTGALLFGTGGTQGSLGEFWYYPGDDGDVTSPIEIQDWSRDRSWRCYASLNDVGEIARFGHGLLRDDHQWIGFEFDSGSLHAVSNDSNTKNRTQIDSTPSPGAYDLRIEFVSGTRSVYYVDGVQEAEHTSNLPSGDSRAPFIFAGRAKNPNSATDVQGSYQKLELVVHQ